MKNILIPTDFNIASFSAISELCRQMNNNNLQLIFVHFFKISDSIGDLLMLSRRNKEYEHVSDEFYEKCENLKATFPHVRSIKIEFFYGSTVRVFRNYLETHLVNAVFDPKNCSFEPLNRLSLDPTMLIEKSGLEVIKLSQKAKEQAPRYVNEAHLTSAV
jgi:hypothetical protein